MKKLLIVGAIILGLWLTSSSAIADVTVNDVDFDPESPTPKSDVTVTANITGLEEDDNVYFTFQECDASTGLCEDPVNASMTKLAITNDFTIDITLTFASGTYFTYFFAVESDGNWTEIKSDSYRVEYTIDSGNGGDNNGGDDNGTPGFELLTLLAAIFIGFILLRKRDRR
jgi:hypothetical protein